MNIFEASNLKELSAFSKSESQLAIFKREPSKDAKDFMSNLIRTPLKLDTTVYKEKAEQDILQLLQENIPTQLQDNQIYKEWALDMAEICKTFCDALADVAVRFRLGSTRGCRRYHADNVSMRLLVTYEGTGTEWLPEAAADRNAYENGQPNEQIIQDASAIQFMNCWDIAIFRGGPNGVLHRTPDMALDRPSILMRLDPIPFEGRVVSHI